MPTGIFIDGSNFYFKLKQLGLTDLKLDFIKLLNELSHGDRLFCRYYVGAVRQERNNSKSIQLYSKQRKFLAKLKSQNIDIFLGYLMKTGSTYHEKGVDVKIAVDIVCASYEKTYDRIILISSDTDLIPAIEKAHENGLDIEYIGFEKNQSFEMVKKCPSYRILYKREILSLLSAS